jgi:hypothetical protein
MFSQYQKISDIKSDQFESSTSSTFHNLSFNSSSIPFQSSTSSTSSTFHNLPNSLFNSSSSISSQFESSSSSSSNYNNLPNSLFENYDLSNNIKINEIKIKQSMYLEHFKNLIDELKKIHFIDMSNIINELYEKFINEINNEIKLLRLLVDNEQVLSETIDKTQKNKINKYIYDIKTEIINYHSLINQLELIIKNI